MTLRYGTNRAGHVNADAAAAALGVSARTVRRWLAGRSGRQLAHIPPRRLEQLVAELAPSPGRQANEQVEATYARDAIAKLQLPRKMGVLPGWESKRWLDQHLVAVLRIRPHRICQLAVTRTGGTTTDTLRKRGEVVDFVVVPSRFHATVLVHEVLGEIGPWRFRAPDGSVKQGVTWAWLDDAPPVDLAATLTRLALP